MPVTLKEVIDHVVAMDEPGTARESSLAGAVRETIAALGLAINTKTGEVYDPAPRSAVLEQRNVRYAGMRRR